MKKIINGKKYDTETAQLMGSYSNGLGCRDFNHYSEELYRKRTGEFFLYGEGGPMTRYAQHVEQNGWSSGEAITPLEYAAAQKWAEENLSTDEYESIFGEVTEDDTRRTLSISISAAADDLVRRRASQSGLSVSAYIESLILQ